jgi:ubiquinone/menaquinone biosynthesis C-methylase UbiE
MHDDTLIREFTHQAESFNTSAVARDDAILRELLRIAAPAGGERWLDAACGPGLVSRALAPLVAAVHGVDATPAMIDVARREAAALPNVTFALGDATALELRDASFDGALARFAIHHVPVPGRLVAELARVVRPGGAVVVADHLADDDADSAAWAQELERLRDPSHWTCLTATALRRLGERAFLTLEAEEIRPLTLDFEDWLRRGSGGEGARALIERSLAERPGGTDCLRVRDGRIELRLWIGRWRAAAA